MRNLLAGHSVLVVEDEPLIAMLYEAYLEELGPDSISFAANVSGALELISGCKFTFAIIDWFLEGEVSLPVLSELRSADVPIIIASGYTGQAPDERPGPEIMLAKPFEANALHVAIHQALRARGSRSDG